jgi:hypothetical protein
VDQAKNQKFDRETPASTKTRPKSSHQTTQLGHTDKLWLLERFVQGNGLIKDMIFGKNAKEDVVSFMNS